LAKTMSVTQSYRPPRILVLFLILVAVATFGAILWSVRGPSAPPIEIADEAKQQRDQWKQQLDALQQEVKGLQTSQQKLAGEMDELRRQTSRESGERKLLSDQVGSLSARVDGLSAKDANAIETVTPQKKRR
jgi:septal ring factor EnvC (AmiA/AmiB activator)